MGRRVIRRAGRRVIRRAGRRGGSTRVGGALLRTGERGALVAVLAVHLAVAAGHGATHALIPVPLAGWQNAVVLAAVFVGPLLGVALALRDRPLGVPLFAASMAAGLAFGLVFHFVVENPDHVHAVAGGPLGVPFQATAAGVLATQALGTVVGAWFWLRE